MWEAISCDNIFTKGWIRSRHWTSMVLLFEVNIISFLRTRVLVLIFREAYWYNCTTEKRHFDLKLYCYTLITVSVRSYVEKEPDLKKMSFGWLSTEKQFLVPGYQPFLNTKYLSHRLNIIINLFKSNFSWAKVVCLF